MSNLYIRKFVERLQHFELRGAKDFQCPIQDAKMLHSEITRLLLDLEQAKTPKSSADAITVEMQGGSF